MIAAVFPFPDAGSVFDESVPPELAASFLPLLSIELGWPPPGLPRRFHFVLPDYRLNQYLAAPGEHGATPYLLTDDGRYALPRFSTDWIRQVQRPDARVEHHRATYAQCRERFLEDRAGFAAEIRESVEATMQEALPAWFDPDAVPHTADGQPMRFVAALSPDWFVDMQAVPCLFYGGGMVKQAYVT